MIAFAVLRGLALAAPAQAAFPGQNGKIAFSEADDIWTMNPDGTGRTQLTGDPDTTGDNTLFMKQGVFVP